MLIVFDLDGTLLNRHQRLSSFTLDILEKLKAEKIAYTIATGRTHMAALPCIDTHHFPLPQIFKNGVEWWDPISQSYQYYNFLQFHHIESTLAHFDNHNVTPFIFCLEDDGSHSVYHPPLQCKLSDHIFNELGHHSRLSLRPLSQLHDKANITNISAMGASDAVKSIVESIEPCKHLTAYSGGGIYDNNAYWLDIHHSNACKGSAVEKLKKQLGLTHVICFGDGDNDLSMFNIADESYAMSNSSGMIKESATATIGHHDEDGVAYFLKDRFNLK